MFWALKTAKRGSQGARRGGGPRVSGAAREQCQGLLEPGTVQGLCSGFGVGLGNTIQPCFIPMLWHRAARQGPLLVDRVQVPFAPEHRATGPREGSVSTVQINSEASHAQSPIGSVRPPC